MRTDARSQYRSRPPTRSDMTPSRITVRQASSCTCGGSRSEAGNRAKVADAPGTFSFTNLVVPVETGTCGSAMEVMCHDGLRLAQSQPGGCDETWPEGDTTGMLVQESQPRWLREPDTAYSMKRVGNRVVLPCDHSGNAGQLLCGGLHERDCANVIRQSCTWMRSGIHGHAFDSHTARPRSGGRRRSGLG